MCGWILAPVQMRLINWCTRARQIFDDGGVRCAGEHLREAWTSTVTAMDEDCVWYRV